MSNEPEKIIYTMMRVSLNIKDILIGGNHEAKKDNRPNLLDGLC